MVITFYSRPGCCLCDDAFALLAPIALEFDASVEVVDISDDPVLSQRFGHHIPVVEVGADVVATLRVHPARVREHLQSIAERNNR